MAGGVRRRSGKRAARRVAKRVWVELSPKGQVIRIFKSHGSAVESGARIEERPKAEAVRDLRWNVFHAADGCCARCGCYLLWTSMHMHEMVPRSKGGEQSLANCQALCSECHLGKDGAHKDRRLK